MKTICPHCHLVSANSQVCTNLGCGKRIAASVQLFARPRRSLPARAAAEPCTSDTITLSFLLSAS